jgi:hypothetical protein
MFSCNMFRTCLCLLCVLASMGPAGVGGREGGGVEGGEGGGVGGGCVSGAGKLCVVGRLLSYVVCGELGGCIVGVGRRSICIFNCLF